MLYNVIRDGDAVSYIPTALGKVLLTVLFAALLAAAVFFAGKKASRTTPLPDGAASGGNAVRRKGASARLTAKQLAFCAMAIALGTVLSNLKIYEFPFGGSVTLLSMLIICLPGYWFGLQAGLIASVAYGVLQLIMDYPLAFGAFGLSGLFTDQKNGLLKGYAAGIVGRWLFTTVSGWIFFAEYAWAGWSPFVYSLTYNGIYIFSEAAITCLVLAIPYVRKTFARIRQLTVQA